MSLPFTRSLRSLEADSYRGSMLGLMFVAPLFLGWLVWFMRGDIALHHVSDQLAHTDEGLIAVTFEDGLPPLITGVDAQLHLQDGDGQDRRVLPAYVHRFVTQTDGSVIAHIDVLADDVEFGNLLGGEAAIEIDTVSPARFLWDMLGDE